MAASASSCTCRGRPSACPCTSVSDSSPPSESLPVHKNTSIKTSSSDIVTVYGKTRPKSPNSEKKGKGERKNNYVCKVTSLPYGIVSRWFTLYLTLFNQPILSGNIKTPN
jgi:hypothetical protein